MFDPINEYDTQVKKGILKCNELQREEYRSKRMKTIEENKKYKVIIAPHRASFFLDIGGGVQIFYGECNRKAFLDEMEAKITNPDTPSAIRRMDLGRIFESNEHKYEKTAGILEAANFRMNREITPDILLSCEVDSLIKLSDGKIRIVEDKFYDGYWAKKHIEGSKQAPGMPKYEHIAQNMFYLSIIGDYYPNVDEVIFHYCTRAEIYDTYHLMSLEKVLDKQDKVIDAFPVINGVKHSFLSLRTLFSRSIGLANYIIENKLPPRDPEYAYNEEKVRYLLSMGQISKQKYKDWQEKGEIIGNWQCDKRYCPYHSLCMGSRPLDQLPSDEEVISKMKSHSVDSIDDLDSMIHGASEESGW